MTKVLTKRYHITYDKSFMAELRRITTYFIKKLKYAKSPNTIIESVMGRIKTLEDLKEFTSKLFYKQSK